MILNVTVLLIWDRTTCDLSIFLLRSKPSIKSIFELAVVNIRKPSSVAYHQFSNSRWLHSSTQTTPFLLLSVFGKKISCQLYLKRHLKFFRWRPFFARMRSTETSHKLTAWSLRVPKMQLRNTKDGKDCLRKIKKNNAYSLLKQLHYTQSQFLWSDS